MSNQVSTSSNSQAIVSEIAILSNVSLSRDETKKEDMYTFSSKADIYTIPVMDSAGNHYDLSQHKGHPILIVNVASKCGFSPQYGTLEALYQKYKADGFIVIGFPCNQFGSQAPGTAVEETLTCQRNFGVTFPIMEKVKVNGDEAHPLWKFLKEQKSGLLGLRLVKWNFEKFLIDKDGKVVGRYMSMASPASIEADIKKFL